jgi:ribulose-bisphosphate carboxylase large chain
MSSTRRSSTHLQATYLIETPLEPARAAEVLAGEQSCGTFARVAGETDELRERARATVDAIEELEPLATPSLPNAWLARQGLMAKGPFRRAKITVSFPIANIGANLATLAATVAGNLYDLGEVTGLRLLSLKLPPEYRARFEWPRHGVSGTRKLAGVAQGPLVGTIIKPNVGLSAEQTAVLVGELCEAGVDFIKDDEVCANPDHAPLDERIRAVMSRVRRFQDSTGKHVMVAFNITDDLDSMRRHAELVRREGGSCVMVSLNWAGFSAVESLRRTTGLAVHGHRNGFGMFSREPALGMDFSAYQTLWRLAGVDHMHVHGLQGKFSQEDSEVIESARECLTSLVPNADDRVMPAFSSGQWAGTVPATREAVNGSDLLFMSGGGILAHPGGPRAGVASIRQAWEAANSGRGLQEAALGRPERARALEFFGGK